MAGVAIGTRPAGTPATRPLLARRTAREDAGPAVAAGVIALLGGCLLYGATAATSVQGGDSGEFQFVGYILGIPHPPGYPLYALIGFAWSHLAPLGEVARRMNLLSVLFGAATLAALAIAAALTFGARVGGAAAGLAAAGWLAVAPTWWGQATIASVRPPTGFFLAATLAALAWLAAERRPRALYLAAALYGLGLTHHISLYTFGPILALFVLSVERRPRVLWRAALCAIAPLAVYLYLPIRSAIGTPFDASHPTTVAAFLALITARGFAGDMLQFNPLAPDRLELGRQILLTNFAWPGLVLGLVGLVATVAVRPRWGLLLVGLASINLAISLSYRAPVIADYVIPAYLVLALGIGGVVGALGRIRRLGSWAAAVMASAVLASPAAYALAHWSSFDLSADRADEQFLHDAFAIAAPGSTILTDWHHATVLQYGQLVRGERPDVTVAYVGPEGDEVPWVRRAEAALTHGPLYTTVLDRRMGERWHLQRRGSIYAVQSEPDRTAPRGLTASGAVWGDAIELIGYRLLEPTSGTDVQIELVWRARQAVGRDYSQFIHLTDARGHVWGQRDGTPGEGVYPTSRWRSGELVVERHGLTAAANAPPGTYAIRAGYYEAVPGGWRRLTAVDAGGRALSDAPTIVEVAIAPLALSAGGAAAPELAGLRRLMPALTERAIGRLGRLVHGDGQVAGSPGWAVRSGSMHVPFGKRALLTGWALDRERGRAGERITVGLDFLPLERIPEDAAVFLHLVDAGGALRVQSDSVPVAGGLPTLRWAPGRPVRDVRTLDLPAALAPGVYQLRAGMYVMATGAHLPVLDDRLAKAGQGDHVVLTELVVGP